MQLQSRHNAPRERGEDSSIHQADSVWSGCSLGAIGQAFPKGFSVLYSMQLATFPRSVMMIDGWTDATYKP